MTSLSGQKKEKTDDYISGTKEGTIKLYDYFSIVIELTRMALSQDILNLSIRMKNKSKKPLFFRIHYDKTTRIIFGDVFHPDAKKYIYIGKGQLKNNILKPSFVEGAEFSFNPKAPCGEFECPGLRMILPYSYEELTYKFEEKYIKAKKLVN